MNSRRFNDNSYIEEYRQNGRFPKIHDDIVSLIQGRAITAPAMDFGSNIGLLSVRLVEQLDIPHVVGIEPGKDFERAVQNPKVNYFNIPVDADNLDCLIRLIDHYEIKVLVARRVISEIGFNNFEFMPVLSEALHAHGIQQIFLEGRVYSVKAVHPIPNSEKECELLSSHYRVEAYYKNCRFLVPK